MVDSEVPGFVVYFDRRNFRDVLFAAGFSSNRVGFVLTLLNIKFPLDHARCKRGSVSDYSESVLVEYLRAKGLTVCRDLPVNVSEVSLYLEQRGYVVRSKYDLETGGFFEPSLN